MRWQLLTLISTMAFSLPAFAQSEEFEELLKEGTVFFDATDYDRALDRYQKARAIYDHPRLRIQIGKTYEKLNKCTTAREIYFAIANDESVDSFERDRANARLAVIDKECTEGNSIPVQVVIPQETETKGEDDAELSAPVETKPRKNLLLPIIGGSMTAVGVIGIVIGTVKTSSERSDIDDAWTALASANGCKYDASNDAIFDCLERGLEETNAYENLADEVTSTNTANTIIFVSSGIVTATGIGLLLYYFMKPNPKKEEGPGTTFSIVPQLSRKYSGVSAQFTF